MKSVLITLMILFSCCSTALADDMEIVLDSTGNDLYPAIKFYGVGAYDKNNIILSVYYRFYDFSKDTLDFNARLYKTTDAGKTWETLLNISEPYDIKSDRPWELPLSDINYISKDTIMLLKTGKPDNCQFLKTYDGGKNWDIVNHSPGSARFMFFDGNKGHYSFHYIDSVWLTSDRGKTWTGRVLPFGTKYNTFDMKSVDFYGDSSVRVIVFDHAELTRYEYISDNWGKDWTLNKSKTDFLIFSQHISPSTIVEIGYLREFWYPLPQSPVLVRRSEDNGVTWDSTISVELDKVHFPRQIIHGAGNNYFTFGLQDICYSKDSCRTWASLGVYEKYKDSYITGFTYLGGDTILVTLREGLLMRHPALKTGVFEQVGTLPELDAFPNPARAGAPLRIALTRKPVPGDEIAMFDMLGRPICSKPAVGRGLQNLELPAGTAPGTYYIAIINQGRISTRTKVVIE